MTHAPRPSNGTGPTTQRSGRRSLLLLTDFYPYEVGEEFLEQEIETLCAAYDEVVVVPVRLSEGARQTRALPANARCALLPASRLPDWRFHAILRAPQILLGRERMVETPPWKSFGRFGMDVRFAAIALSAYGRMRRLLPDLGLERAGHLTIYSYWFFTGAALGGMLRRRELRGRPVKVVSRAHALHPRGSGPANAANDVDVDLPGFGIPPAHSIGPGEDVRAVAGPADDASALGGPVGPGLIGPVEDDLDRVVESVGAECRHGIAVRGDVRGELGAAHRHSSHPRGHVGHAQDFQGPCRDAVGVDGAAQAGHCGSFRLSG